MIFQELPPPTGNTTLLRVKDFATEQVIRQPFPRIYKSTPSVKPFVLHAELLRDWIDYWTGLRRSVLQDAKTKGAPVPTTGSYRIRRCNFLLSDQFLFA